VSACRYPPFRGPRLPLAEAAKVGRGPVAGRLHIAPDGVRLRDSSGEIRLVSIDGDSVVDGDWISGRLAQAGDDMLRLESVVLHARRNAPTPDAELPSKHAALRTRAAIVAAARSFFREHDFLEVDTPARVICPGLEPHLSAFPAGGDRYLITSPELHLKRLLASGSERLVEFSRSFRDEEQGPWHLSEFTMLEWYRVFAGLDAMEKDCEGLVAACASASGVDVSVALAGCDLTPPFERTTVRNALREATGLDLAELNQRQAMARAVAERGHPVAAEDSWDEIFFRVWIAEVEPRLGCTRPVFVHDYPASQAALARTRREPWGEVAERFELYVAGHELANAFHELNDPQEQRRRHEADRAERRAAGREAYPLDERFLQALEAGMPPSSGIALGLDRLVALLVGATSLDQVTAFP